MDAEMEHGRIAAVIRTLMEDEEISGRAQLFKERAEESLRRGGSTDRAVNELVELIRSFQHTKCTTQALILCILFDHFIITLS